MGEGTVRVSEESVGDTCIGTIFKDDGPTIVALACERAAAKAPMIPEIWLFIALAEL